MHNAAFAAAGLDWAYVPFPVRPDLVHEAVRGLAALGVAGANVTIPHKQAVLPACDELEPVARRCASVNTLVVRDDGSVLGTSTDGEGAARIGAAGASVLVLGAGGAARPVAVALADRGAARISVAARRRAAAERLAEELTAADLGAVIDVAPAWPPDTGAATVVVNATPVADGVLVRLGPGQALLDLAYRSDGRRTALVEHAMSVGCHTVVDGLEFLVRQGAASYERWTGTPAPVDAMTQALGAA
jgi:shikimate dehydrogenase